ncbi:hypothetical protein I3215_06905 [Streptomyces sp. RB110-1]|nr:hypothetical protein [Streptomyces sp. RB110-1]MBK0384617.1 hypothetical protein [Streptomyces sp. RB110-2]
MLHCPQCPPGGPPTRRAASGALEHLAWHARRDVLPRYLRTCQCHSRGCRWHARHRGCSGPVLLVLTREDGGRLWRLADVCAACAAATAHAAVVPDTVLTPTRSAEPGKRAQQKRRRARRCGPSEQLRVREMLSYLAAALPAHTSPPARLLALQCALRSTGEGEVNIPTGLLRGMRLGRDTAALTELQEARWLCSSALPDRRSGGFAAQLLDVSVRMQAPTVRDRSRAADWVLRTCQRRELRELDALSRLLALTLAVHVPAGRAGPPTPVEQEVLARMCGLQTQGLASVLNVLVRVRFLRSWAHGPAPEDLHWELAMHGEPVSDGSDLTE